MFLRRAVASIVHPSKAFGWNSGNDFFESFDPGQLLPTLSAGLLEVTQGDKEQCAHESYPEGDHPEDYVRRQAGIGVADHFDLRRLLLYQPFSIGK